MVDLVVLAEETGWDGFFVWDHLCYPAPVHDILDPYIYLAVIDARTQRISLEPVITPFIRRRPQVVSRQAVAPLGRDRWSIEMTRATRNGQRRECRGS